MKKIFILLFLGMLPFGVFSQVTFGYLSMKEAVESLPDFAEAQQKFKNIQEAFNVEIKRSEDDLAKKYVDFLQDEQRLPENIRAKRQKELQDMMERNLAFKNEIHMTLKEAKDSIFGPLHEKVLNAVELVCIEKELAYVLDTDKRTYLFINDKMGGVDITISVKIALGLNVGVAVPEIKPLEDTQSKGATIQTELNTVTIENAVVTDSLNVASDSIDTKSDKQKE